MFRHDEKRLFETCVSFCVGVDEGGDESTREWLSVVNCDVDAVAGGFRFALPRVGSDDLDAESSFKLLENCGVDWKKVFWFVCDGASVMDKLGRLLAERLNPLIVKIYG